MVCVLSYILEKLIDRQVKGKGVGLSAREALREH